MDRGEQLSYLLCIESLYERVRPLMIVRFESIAVTVSKFGVRFTLYDAPRHSLFFGCICPVTGRLP